MTFDVYGIPLQTIWAYGVFFCLGFFVGGIVAIAMYVK